MSLFFWPARKIFKGSKHAWKHIGKKVGIDPSGKLWKGKENKLKKFNTLSHKQRRTLDKLLGHISPGSFDIGKNSLYKTGSGFLQNLLRSKFQPRFNAMDILGTLEAPMMRQFREEIIPSVAERFAGFDALGSSAAQQAMGGAGAGLQERLAALKGNLALQAQQDLGNQESNFLQQQLQAANMGIPYSQIPAQTSLNLAQLGLGTPAFGYMNIPGQPGVGQGLMGGLGRLGGGLGGMAAGAAIGSIVPGIGTAMGAGIGGLMGAGMSGG